VGDRLRHGRAGLYDRCEVVQNWQQERSPQYGTASSMAVSIILKFFMHRAGVAIRSSHIGISEYSGIATHAC
jgi:hypothetical protein